jgi:hypothetical protein
MKTLLLAVLLFAQRPTPVGLQTGTITGRLLNEDGSPAAKVRVSAMSIPENRNGGNEAPTLMTLTETESDGRYRLADVPVGRYYIVAGFVDSPTYYPRGTGAAGATAVNVTLNATTPNIDFRIERPSSGLTISGRVIQEASSLGQVQVSLSGQNNGSYVNSTAPVKLDGSFEFVRVRPGTYTLTANPSPFPEPRTITVTDKDVTGVAVRLPWTGEVIGRVTVDGGGPAPTFSMLFKGENRQVSSYYQGSSETFRTTLPEGFFVFTATPIPSGFYVKSVTSGTTDLLSNPLHMGRTNPPSEIAVTLGVSTPSPWVKVSGYVKGLPAGTTSISFSGPIASISTPVAADGSFEFPKLLPGVYTMTTGVALGRSWQAITLTVPHRDVAGVELALPVTREITGRIIVEDGAPVPRPSLLLSRSGEDQSPSNAPTAAPSMAKLLVSSPEARSEQQVVYLTVEQDGSFKTSIPEGRYTVTTQVPQYASAPSYSVKSFSYGSTDLLKESLVIGDANSSEMRLTFSPLSVNRWVKVSGRVIGMTATSASSGRVTVSLTNPLLAGSVTTNVRADGSFEFPRVYSGNYQTQVSGVSSPLPIAPVSVAVSNSDVTNVEIVVPRQKQVSGRLILEGRGVLPRFNIPLTFTGGSNAGQTTTINVSPRPDGGFTVTLPVGEHQLGRPSNMPAGYSLKSVQYGSTNLFAGLFRVTEKDAEELRITIATPDLPPVKVRGKVTGLDAPTVARGITLNLTDPRLVTTLQAAVLNDGSFEFPAVFPGNYNTMLSVTIPAFRMPTVNVANREITDLEIILPRLIQIAGRVVLEGSGPIPRLSIPFTTTGGASPQTAMVSINTQGDSTFRVTLPEGQFQLGRPNGLPNGFTLKSVQYGSTDVTGATLKVSSAEPAELRLTITTPDLPRFKVSGKVSGLDPTTLARGSINVSLTETRYAIPLQVAVRPDGSFQFPDVFPGNYTARISAALPYVNASFVPVNVTSSDVTNVELVAPRVKEIVGRVVLEGSGAMPRMTVPLVLTAPGPTSSAMTTTISPQPDGTFRLSVPEGSRRVGQVIGLPEGYKVKSITYGNVDLLTTDLQVTASDTAELRITVSTPSLKPVQVSGRVNGIDPTMFSRGPVSITLTATPYATPLVASVAPDGSFSFPEVFPGAWSARATGPGIAPGQTLSITVANTDVRNVEFGVPAQKEVIGRVVLEGPAPMPRFSFRPTQELGGLRNSIFLPLIAINPAPNGTFRVTLPEGERPLGELTGLPAGYTLKAATYGTTDLLREPLKISRKDTAELVLTVTAPTIKPVSVSGKVEGLDSAVLARGIARVMMGSPTFGGSMFAPVKPDGTFEFPSVFPGTYLAQVAAPTLPENVPPNIAVQPNAAGVVTLAPVGVPAVGPSGTSIAVTDKDIRDLTLSLPRQHLIVGRLEIQGGGPFPRLPLTFSGLVSQTTLGATTVTPFNPQSDGTFRFTLPEGDRTVNVAQLPAGYALKSITYGNTDPRQTPLRVEANKPTSELRVTLEKTAPTPWVRVSGKVTGLPAEAQNIRVGLIGAFNVPQEVAVNPDGTFAFPQVFQGPSSVRLLGNIGATLPPLVNFTAGAGDITNLEIVIQR